MADFCNKCAEEMGFPEPDLDVFKIKETLEKGFYTSCICEGCGFLGIARGENDETLVIFEDKGKEGGYKFVDYDKDYKGLNFLENE
jgi:hypothetical protein